MSLTSDALLEAMQTFPLHRQFGFTITSHGDGLCEAACTIDSAHLNFGGVVHGGVMYLLLDVTAYCAAVTILPADTNARTHDIHVSMMRPTPAGAQLVLRAAVRKRGRSLYFIDSEATSNGQLVASARITKSLVPLPAGSFQGGAQP